MPEDNKKSAGNPSDYEFNALNNVSLPTAPMARFDPHTTGYYDLEHRLQQDHFTPDALQSRSQYRAIVLRVFDKKAGSADPNSWYSLPVVKMLLGSEKVGLLVLRVRIPEIHAACPLPTKFGDDGPGPSQGKINNYYPIVVAESTSTPACAAGDIVYVDFGDRVNLTDGIYLGPVIGGNKKAEEDRPNSGSGAHKKNPKEVNRPGPEVGGTTIGVIALHANNTFKEGGSTDDNDWTGVAQAMKGLGNNKKNIDKFKEAFEEANGRPFDQAFAAAEHTAKTDVQKKAWKEAEEALIVYETPKPRKKGPTKPRSQGGGKTLADLKAKDERSYGDPNVEDE